MFYTRRRHFVFGRAGSGSRHETVILASLLRHRGVLVPASGGFAREVLWQYHWLKG